MTKKATGSDDPQIADRLGDGLRTPKQVPVARLQLVGLTVGGQIEVWFVFRVTSQSDARSDLSTGTVIVRFER